MRKVVLTAKAPTEITPDERRILDAYVLTQYANESVAFRLIKDLNKQTDSSDPPEIKTECTKYVVDCMNELKTEVNAFDTETRRKILEPNSEVLNTLIQLIKDRKEESGMKLYNDLKRSKKGD